VPSLKSKSPVDSEKGEKTGGEKKGWKNPCRKKHFGGKVVERGPPTYLDGSGPEKGANGRTERKKNRWTGRNHQASLLRGEKWRGSRPSLKVRSPCWGKYHLGNRGDSGGGRGKVGAGRRRGRGLRKSGALEYGNKEPLGNEWKDSCKKKKKSEHMKAHNGKFENEKKKGIGNGPGNKQKKKFCRRPTPPFQFIEKTVAEGTRKTVAGTKVAQPGGEKVWG